MGVHFVLLNNWNRSKTGMQKATREGGFCGRSGNQQAQSGAKSGPAIAAKRYDKRILTRCESLKNFGDLTLHPAKPAMGVVICRWSVNRVERHLTASGGTRRKHTACALSFVLDCTILTFFPTDDGYAYKVQRWLNPDHQGGCRVPKGQ